MRQLFIHILKLPLRTFFYSMEALTKTVTDIPRVALESFGIATERRPTATATTSVETGIGGQERRSASIATRNTMHPIADCREIDLAKEDQRVYEKIDDMHDLSGNMVKVVQWAIITTVTGITENARVIVPSEIAAFSDDLTPEDFSTWAITLSARKIEEYKIKWEAELREQRSLYQLPVPPWDPKFLRVAYFVMNRFTVADIDYEELTAIETRNVAGTLNNVVRGLRSIAREIPMDNIEFSVKPPSKNTLSEDPKDNKPEAQDSSGEFPSNNE